MVFSSDSTCSQCIHKLRYFHASVATVTVTPSSVCTLSSPAQSRETVMPRTWIKPISIKWVTQITAIFGRIQHDHQVSTDHRQCRHLRRPLCCCSQLKYLINLFLCGGGCRWGRLKTNTRFWQSGWAMKRSWFPVAYHSHRFAHSLLRVFLVSTLPDSDRFWSKDKLWMGCGLFEHRRQWSSRRKNEKQPERWRCVSV